MLAALLLLASAGPLTDLVEGWAVPPGTRVEVDALSGIIRLTTTQPLPVGSRDAPAPPFPSTLCRRESQIGKRLVMRCDSRFLAAEVVSAKGKTQVVVRRLLAPPTLDGDATLPLFTYDPAAVQLGGACPGDNAASRAECLLQAGDLVGAVAPLREALEINPVYSSLRLGDLALLSGDPERAGRFWDRTQGLGPFGRLAAARLCELLGRCEPAAAAEIGLRFDALDDVGLPDPVADEMVLRRVRLRAYQGRFDDVVQDLLSADLRPCKRAVAFCQRVLLEAFRERGGADTTAELAAWLALPARDGTTSSAELASLAADAARDVGAPGFAATVWSHALDRKRGPELEDGMLKITALYLDAGEGARAATVMGYAKRSFPSTKRKARWAELHAELERLDREGAGP